MKKTITYFHLLLISSSLTIAEPVEKSGSKHSHMRELRIQHAGDPYRVLYAFDPRRCAILLIGGNKTGNDRWYDEFVPKADTIYDNHTKELDKEGLL